MELETPCKSQVLHDDLNLSRGSKIEETDRLLPAVRRADDFGADKSSGSVEEREEFPEDFDTYLRKKLNWSRLEYDGGDSHVSGWVFWNRQDDRPKTLPVSDFENVVVFPDSRPKLEDKIRLALGRIILHPQYDWCDESFLHNLCNVFQELGLQSSDVHKHCEIKYKDEDKEALTTAFHELTLLLKLVYESHKLPLALTWVPCNACDALLLGQRSSNGGEYLQSFKANDNHLVKSLIASTGYHLRKGHLAKMVLGSTSMLYCSDVTQFSITEYPLVPFARQFKLSGWFTVCLHSRHTGEYVYMLEFFLKDNENTLTQVSTILGTMEKNSGTFKLASGKELGEVLSVEIFDFCNGQRYHNVQRIQASLELLNDGDDGMNVINAEQGDTVATISKRGTTKSQEREHKKIGVRFNISLEDVLQFSALSRKDAAEKLKVSESTLKRVCRKYGIHRWPPRDLNKEEVLPLPLPNFEDIGHLDSPEEMEVDEVDATKYGPHDVRTESTDHSRPSSSHLENESLVTIENLQHFGHGSEDFERSLGGSVSTMKRIGRQQGIKRRPYRQNGGGAMKQLDSDQPSMDEVNNGRSSIGAEHSQLDVTFSEERSIITQDRKKGKTGVKIEIPLEVVLQYSNLRLDNAARELKVSSSTLKRVCRQYGIHRWPPRNIDDVGAPLPSHDVPPRNLDKVGAPLPSLVELQEGISELTSDRPLASDSRNYRIPLRPPPNRNKVGAPGPSHVEHQDGSSQLTSDMPSKQTPLREEGILQLTLDRPSNQALDDGTHVKPRDTAVQDTKTVTIRAKYVNVTLKFQLPLRSRLEELHQQVGKRLNLKPEAYDIFYEDDDGELILMVCDDDLTECINTNRSRSSSKNSIVVLIERKKLM
ncbi:hypothetical protein Vadar_011292 [Vaccinium darrowii]|uniref:Uncharacterized protein n=1 Tax=Vaccinium darrowii TaxID=229202 RepID=A0ACB7XGU6_9ERIC|nr:hypothetical protein Vadar_011292 [Vaccinium darrowii]